MPKTIAAELVIDTARRVLSQAAYVYPQPMEESAACSDDRTMIRVAVKYSGSRSGQIEMILPLELCGEIAANMLGVDAENCGDTASREDAARELLNIYAGGLLTDCYGRQATFSLSPPETMVMSSEECRNAMADPSFARMTIDDAPLLARCLEWETEYECQSSHC